jgi:hypothetical protein
MPYTTINELVEATKKRIDELNCIADTLLSEYRISSEIIDHTTDRRKKYLDQLIELEETLSNIVDTHPAISSYGIWRNATNVLAAIVDEESEFTKI